MDIALKKSIVPAASTKGTVVLPLSKPHLGTVAK